MSVIAFEVVAPRLFATVWGNNPETASAIVTGVTGLMIVVTAVLVLVQLRQERKAREAAVLMTLLEQFVTEFLSRDVYERLLDQATTMAKVGAVKDWSDALDDDEVQLVKLMKLYSVAGSLLDEGMIRRGPLLSFICAPLRHHYRDFQPFIATSASRPGIEKLHLLCADCFPPGAEALPTSSSAEPTTVGSAQGAGDGSAQ